MELNWLLDARQEFVLRMPCGKGVKPPALGYHLCHEFASAPGATGHFEGGNVHLEPPPGERCLCIPNQQRWAAAAPRACSCTLPMALASAEEGAEDKGLLV